MKLQNRPCYFGPRSLASSRLKVANGSLRKPTRFLSKPMKKILEDVEKRQTNMQSILGNKRNRKDISANSAYVHKSKIHPSMMVINKPRKSNYSEKDHQGNHVIPQSKQHFLDDGKVGQRNPKSFNEDFPIVATSPKSRNAFSSKKLVMSSVNSEMKQGFLHANYAKLSSSQPKNLKAMPGLVLNSKRQLNIDQEPAMWKHKGGMMNGCHDITNDEDVMSRKELLSKDKSTVHDDNGSEGEDPTHWTMKRRRKYIATNEEDIGNQSLDDVINDTNRLASSDDILKDRVDRVPMQVVAVCLKKQCYCCSQPIDEPIWSGLLNMGNKQYIPLSGHLSTKSLENVRNLSKSLSCVVEVAKLPRSKVWPKRWEAPRPMNDNIGLYFLPHKMRHDKSHDQLLKEVMENDLALRAIIDDTEMLMFHSTLLPKRYQTFQMKHYLWGVFKPKELEGKRVAAQHQPDHTTGSTAFGAKATATGISTDAVRIPPGPTDVATDAAGLPHTVRPANHGQIDASSMGAPPGRMLAFVVKENPRLERLEMQREGALVMQGEVITNGSAWPGNIATVTQRGPPGQQGDGC